MKKALIFDPPHGVETKGKRSPDGRHREWFWGREIEMEIINGLLKEKNFSWDLYFPFVQIQNEVLPRINRVQVYNSIASNYDETLVVSYHNDAAPESSLDSEGWCNKAKGAAVWTSKGQDDSDLYATKWFNFMNGRNPEIHYRKQTYTDGDVDYENDFTILAGYGSVKPLYKSFLVEWGFQTNKEDVEALLSKELNKQFSQDNVDFFKWL